MDFNWLEAVGLFFVSFALDAVFALYTFAVMKHQPAIAGFWSMATYLLMAAGILSFVHNRWYIVPLSLGAYGGAYAVVKWESTKESKKTAKKAAK